MSASAGHLFLAHRKPVRACSAYDDPRKGNCEARAVMSTSGPPLEKRGADLFVLCRFRRNGNRPRRLGDLLIGDEETSRSAAITIELYRQGVRNFDQLKVLVFAARGKICDPAACIGGQHPFASLQTRTRLNPFDSGTGRGSLCGLHGSSAADTDYDCSAECGHGSEAEYPFKPLGLDDQAADCSTAGNSNLESRQHQSASTFCLVGCRLRHETLNAHRQGPERETPKSSGNQSYDREDASEREKQGGCGDPAGCDND
jgi:hypothetical protein